MNQVVAHSIDNLIFTFHCTDGDVYTYKHAVQLMAVIERGMNDNEITNSFKVPFDKRIVAAGLTLQVIGRGLEFSQFVGRIDNKTLQEIIRFYRFVGNWDISAQYFMDLVYIIRTNVQDFLPYTILDHDCDYIYTEILELYSFYKMGSLYSFDICFNEMTLQAMLEFLDIANDSELTDVLIEMRSSKEYTRAKLIKDILNTKDSEEYLKDQARAKKGSSY